MSGFPTTSDSSFNTPSDDDFNKTANTAVVGGIVTSILGSVVVIVVVVLLLKYCKKNRMPSVNVYSAPQPSPAIPKMNINAGTVENFLDNIFKEQIVRFTAEQLQVFTRNYANKLGSGGFGTVYKGELPNGVPLAVKLLSGNLDRRVVEAQFMAEIGTIGKTNHINLVRLYGFCFDAGVSALVYEFMENGSLEKYLFSNKQIISWGTLHEVAIGAAKGIRYLHEECQQRIIHYDIKPGNILLDMNFNPKVADFGLAKLLNRERTHVTLTGGRGTPGYAAPEMWMPSPVTYKCDVYSFGMLLFEIVGRRRNLDLTVTESQEWFPKQVYDKFENGALADIVSVCGIEEEYKDKVERMCKVALWCVQYSPEARPPMNKVVKMLEGEMEINPPMNPFQHLFSSNPVYSNLWSETDTDSGSTGTKQDATTIMRKYEIGFETRE